MRHLLSKPTVVLLSMASTSASAVDLNYESLSFLEEPLATEIGDVTLELQGIVDTPYTYNTDLDDGEWSLNSLVQLKAETQLDNSVTLGAVYFGEYDTAEESDYEDKFAVFAQSYWGAISVGDVTGMVREETRRLRGVGNSVLAFDDFIGRLDEQGITYTGRFGPSRFAATVDELGQYSIGWSFQRPLGNKDYRFSLRYQDSEYLSSVDTVYLSQALTGMAELTYGSSTFDLAISAENLESDLHSLDRWFVSAGARRKFEAFTFSAEAHVGEFEGARENALALGLRYDIARGLSVNLGINLRDFETPLNGFEEFAWSRSEYVGSIRYVF